MSEHYWIRAARRRDRERLLAGIDVPPVLASLDAHRRLRGPYTAAGTLVRMIAQDDRWRHLQLGARYPIEVSTCAPELAGEVPTTWTSLEWTVGEGERTRFYSRLHTLNIANGLAELIRDYLGALQGGPRTLVFENAHEADPTDQELIAVLLRRTDLGALSVVVGTGVEPLADPKGELAISLADELAECARPVDAAEVSSELDAAEEALALARAYVESDGTSDDPALIAAYEDLPPADRMALHDSRAATLAAIGEKSLELGAIPYHAEHGSDYNTAVGLLKVAIRHCRGIGLYQATVDLGLRARAIVDRSVSEDLWWHFTEATSVSMASLGRADEAEAIYGEARASSQDPKIHMDLAYSTAMLYARHYPEDRRDYQQARAWMNTCIAIASLLGDPKDRAFHTVFGGNGLALVEVRQKNAEEALRLLEDGMARLDEELEPGEQALHRVVLRYNRAQVLGMMGRLEESLADYMAVVETDPDFPEHHFNIGNILRRLGRNEEAINAYERALTKSPPFPEAYYNRGDARLDLGDRRGALEDFEHTVQLEPSRVDAHVNRAGLLRELGDADAAEAAVRAGLTVAPRNPHLLCVSAQLLADQGRTREARQAVSVALEEDESLAEAWAIRGELSYLVGDLERAAADLDRAVQLADSATIRFNRAVVHQDAGHYEAAAEDYKAVLTAVADEDAERRLSVCRQAVDA